MNESSNATKSWQCIRENILSSTESITDFTMLHTPHINWWADIFCTSFLLWPKERLKSCFQFSCLERVCFVFLSSALMREKLPLSLLWKQPLIQANFCFSFHQSASSSNRLLCLCTFVEGCLCLSPFFMCVYTPINFEEKHVVKLPFVMAAICFSYSLLSFKHSLVVLLVHICLCVCVYVFAAGCPTIHMIVPLSSQELLRKMSVDVLLIISYNDVYSLSLDYSLTGWLRWMDTSFTA